MGRHGVDLGDVEDVPNLGEIGRNVLPRRQVPEAVVLLEGRPEVQRQQEAPDPGDHAAQPGAPGVPDVLGDPVLHLRHRLGARVRRVHPHDELDERVLLLQAPLPKSD